MLEAELRKLGFGKRKIDLYTSLLKAGGGSAAELAKAAGIKRTTTYDILKELCVEKLATVTFEGKRQIFTIEPPENLKLMIERQVAAVDRVMPGLKELYRQNDNKPRIRFYEGTEGLKYVHDELLKVKSKEYYYFGSMSAFQDALGHDYVVNFIQKRIRRKIWSNAIRIKSQEVDDPITLAGDENYRRVRYLSKPLESRVANLTLFEGKIAILSSSEENYALIIESAEMFTILKFLWDFVWDLADK